MGLPQNVCEGFYQRGVASELRSLAKGPRGTAGSWSLPGSLDISAGTVTSSGLLEGQAHCAVGPGLILR